MKVIIAGSRGITDRRTIWGAISDSGFQITEVVSGGAKGVDTMGEAWAFENGEPVKQFLPDWDKYAKGAGFIRNVEMSKYAEALIAVWDGKSSGTKHMIDCARRRGLKVFVRTV